MQEKFIKFTEIYEAIGVSTVFSLRVIYISRDHVVSYREDPVMKERLKDGRLPKGLLSEQEFTKIELNAGSNVARYVVVVGELSGIDNKLSYGDKNVI